jgi:hypothetical protein
MVATTKMSWAFSAWQTFLDAQKAKKKIAQRADRLAHRHVLRRYTFPFLLIVHAAATVHQKRVPILCFPAIASCASSCTSSPCLGRGRGRGGGHLISIRRSQLSSCTGHGAPCYYTIPHRLRSEKPKKSC